jgi:hypothetical protein
MTNMVHGNYINHSVNIYIYVYDWQLSIPMIYLYSIHKLPLDICQYFLNIYYYKLPLDIIPILMICYKLLLYRYIWFIHIYIYIEITNQNNKYWACLKTRHHHQNNFEPLDLGKSRECPPFVVSVVRLPLRANLPHSYLYLLIAQF